MSPWLKHGGISRTVMDALETMWTGSGMMMDRRLEGLKLRRSTVCALW